MNPLNLIAIVTLLYFASACASVSSSELKETKAEDLRITATVYERSNDSDARINASMETLPDGVDVKFNQGETLTATAQLANDQFLPSLNMAYDASILNLGGGYVTHVQKAPVGKQYSITYTDPDHTQTSASFTSQGVPDLILPAANQEVALDQSLEFTWVPQNLGNLEITVSYSLIGGGVGFYSLTVPDNGRHVLDLTRDPLNRAASGSTDVALKHTTRHTSAPGFGEARLQVVSSSEREIIFEPRTSVAALVARTSPENLTDEAIAQECHVECAENERVIVNHGNGWIDCCVAEGSLQ